MQNDFPHTFLFLPILLSYHGSGKGMGSCFYAAPHLHIAMVAMVTKALANAIFLKFTPLFAIFVHIVTHISLLYEFLVLFSNGEWSYKPFGVSFVTFHALPNILQP